MESEQPIPNDESTDLIKPPKKRTTATPNENVSDAKKKRRRSSSGGSRSGNPATKDMILEAIEILDNPAGVSVINIRHFIQSHYGDREKYVIRNALNSLVKDNKILRPDGKEIKAVLGGRWILAPEFIQEQTTARERPASLRQTDVLQKVKEKYKLQETVSSKPIKTGKSKKTKGKKKRRKHY